MPRASGWLCAGLFLCLSAAGCASADAFSLFFLQSTTTGRDRVVAGSVESVSRSTQAALTELGFTAIVSEQAGVVRITSSTRTGQKFALVLRREKKDPGEYTRVHLEWEGTGDDQAGFQIMSQVESQRRS